MSLVWSQVAASVRPYLKGKSITVLLPPFSSEGSEHHTATSAEYWYKSARLIVIPEDANSFAFSASIVCTIASNPALSRSAKSTQPFGPPVLSSRENGAAS